MHPRHEHPRFPDVCKKQHPVSKNACQNCGRPRYDIPQSIRHDFVLPLQDFFFRRWLFSSFYLINKQANNIKQSRKPRNDEDEM
jgi:hypothetical protein